jgi:serine O-acetyltransferase
MITSKKELKEYLQEDALANGRSTTKVHILGDSIWRNIVCMRKKEYYKSLKGLHLVLNIPGMVMNRYLQSKLSIRCGFTLPIGVFDKGLSIAHKGTIIVNANTKVGKNCRIHEGVTIGTTNGSNVAPVIGNNVFIATGAKIIGDIYIADDVAIGANAVVVKSIMEPGTTWGGVPARKISNNNSHSNLSKLLELD